MNRFFRALQALRNPDLLMTAKQRGQDVMLPSVLAWPSNAWGSPTWTLVNYQSYAQDGYSINSLIYGAINYKMRAISSAPLRAYEGPEDAATLIADDHPLARLLQQPNSEQSQQQFLMMLTVMFNIAGNAFIYLVRDAPAQVPQAMYLLRPDWVKLVPNRSDDGKGLIAAYLYMPGGQEQDGVPLPPGDVIHIKLPNPMDQLGGAGMGLSPFAAVARPGNVDNDVTKFLKSFFEKGAMFQTAIVYKVPLSQTQVDQARARLEQIYGGASNWHRFAVLDNEASVERLTPTFDEMGFESIDFRNETRILGPFGVPPILIGARIGLDRATMANYDESRRQCWEDTLLPEIRLIENGFRKLGIPGLHVRADTGNVPALQRNVNELVTAATALIDRGVPPRVAFEVTGLDVPEYDGDRTGYLNTIPVASLPEENAPQVTDGAPSGDGDNAALGIRPDGSRDWGVAANLIKDVIPVQNVRKVPNHQAMNVKINALAERQEDRYGEAAAAAFEQERRTIEAMIRDEYRAALSRKQSFDWSRLKYKIQEYYKQTARKLWRDTFAPLIRGTMQESAEAWALELETQVIDIAEIAVETWFETYILTFSDPITDTSEKAMSTFLDQAQREGWGVDQTVGHMDQIFQQWAYGDLEPTDFEWLEARMPAYRREMIARTESIRAANAGATGTAGRLGATRKLWIATFDGRTRDDHLQAHYDYNEGGTYGPIPLTDSFVVGGVQMQFPGDPQGTPEQFINCRCTVSFIKD